MKSLAIIALALSLGIPGNIHGEYMTVKRNTRKSGCVLVDSNGDAWVTDKVKGTRKGKRVLVYMSDNDTPEYKYDDIIVTVRR